MTADARQSDDRSPARRISAVAADLRVLRRRFEAERDRRAVFTYAYEVMTERLAAALVEIDWSDADWLAALDEEFAGRFFRAVAAADRGADVPGAWDYVFRTVRERRTSVLEDLVLGMAAHIVWDLPIALRDTSPGGDMSRHLDDFHAVNRVLGEAIDDIQTRVSRRYDRLLGWLDVLGRDNDEILTDYGIRVSRGMAWYNAERLAHPALAEAALVAIARSPRVVAERIVDPPFKPLRLTLRALRWLSSFFRRWPAGTHAAGHGPDAGDGAPA